MSGFLGLAAYANSQTDNPKDGLLLQDAIREFVAQRHQMTPERWIKENIVLDDWTSRQVFELFVFLRRIKEQGLDLADFGGDDLTYGEECCECRSVDFSICQPDGSYLCCEHIQCSGQHK